MEKQNDYILEFRNVCKVFPGVKALDNISFGVRRGTIHCLMGENGAGKSTLMKVIDGLYKPDGGEIVGASGCGKSTISKLISGLYKPWSGEILFDGKPWKPKGSAEARTQGIAMIHQELNIIPEMTVAQNIYLGREMMEKNRILLDDKKMLKEATNYLEEQGLHYDLTCKMGELSIAEAQMIEIVKAISCNAKIILMDEPTSSLTEKEVSYLISKIFELKEKGITIIFISHKLDEVMEIADYISVFRDGTHVITDKASAFTRASMIEKMVGREMKEVFPPRSNTIGDTLFEVKLYMSF